jgi:hypothetical protein
VLRIVQIAGLAVALVLGAAAAAQSVSIQLQNGVFKVVGWRAPASAPSPGWASLFAVYSGSGDVPAMVGQYSVEGGFLVFRPEYPLAAGAKYRAVFQTPGGQPVVAMFDGPKRETVPMTRVERVYPSADVLPSNDLKLYIYFSAPMSRGEAWEHVELLDAGGKKLPYIFLEFAQELWDADNQRLTLWFDPGRIKRGLTSNINLGPPIEEGQRYTLSIDRNWHDARGVPLVEGYKKVFRGGPADRTAPDPQKWRITAPKAGTSEPFVVDFGEPMDYVGLQKTLSVSAAVLGPLTVAGNQISGTAVVSQMETRWSFTPRQPWTAGNYQLLVNSALEDLAANKIGQLFDMDVFDKVDESIQSKTYPVPFSVR